MIGNETGRRYPLKFMRFHQRARAEAWVERSSQMAQQIDTWPLVRYEVVDRKASPGEPLD